MYQLLKKKVQLHEGEKKQERGERKQKKLKRVDGAKEE